MANDNLQNRSSQKQLLQKYLRNECNEEELASVFALLNKPPQKLSEVQDLIEEVLQKAKGDINLDSAHKQLLWNQVQQDIRKNQRTGGRSMPDTFHRKKTGFPLKLVATLALIIVSTFVIVNNFTDSHDEPVKWVEKINKAGKISSFQLPDGTKVWLNVASKITYPEKFTEKSRPVKLQGEAYFEVLRDEAKPFIVNANKVNVQVLGTSFNVKVYQNEPAEVLVSTGSVQVNHTPDTSKNSGGNKSVILYPNQRAVYNQRDGDWNLEKLDPTGFLAWRQGMLKFNSITIKEAARIIERWYDVSVRFEHEDLMECRITAEYKSESLVNILESLSYFLQIDYEISDKVVVLKGKGC